MTDITKEYLDKQLGKLATKTDIKDVKTDIVGLRTDVDGVRTDIVGLKTDVDGLRTDIDGVRGLVVKEVGKLARMTADGLEEIKRELDVRSEVENLNHRMIRIEQALNIKN